MVILKNQLLEPSNLKSIINLFEMNHKNPDILGFRYIKIILRRDFVIVY